MSPGGQFPLSRDIPSRKSAALIGHICKLRSTEGTVEHIRGRWRPASPVAGRRRFRNRTGGRIVRIRIGAVETRQLVRIGLVGIVVPEGLVRKLIR